MESGTALMVVMKRAVEKRLVKPFSLPVPQGHLAFLVLGDVMVIEIVRITVMKLTAVSDLSLIINNT